MRIQTKVGLAILPVVALSIAALGLWSVKLASDGIQQSALEHMNAVLENFVAHDVSALHALLVKN